MFVRLRLRAWTKWNQDMKFDVLSPKEGTLLVERSYMVHIAGFAEPWQWVETNMPDLPEGACGEFNIRMSLHFASADAARAFTAAFRAKPIHETPNAASPTINVKSALRYMAFASIQWHMHRPGATGDGLLSHQLRLLVGTDWHIALAVHRVGSNPIVLGVLRITLISRQPPRVLTCCAISYQEIHFDTLDMVHVFDDLCSYHIKHPAGRSTGGISIYVRQSRFAKISCAACHFEELCLRRVIRLHPAGPHPLWLVVHLVRDQHHTMQLAEVALDACDCLPPLFLIGGMNVVYVENNVVSDNDCGDPRPTPFSSDGRWWWQSQCAELLMFRFSVTYTQPLLSTAHPEFLLVAVKLLLHPVQME
eukprot:420875-Amphidinium_carterae.2